MKKSMFIVIVCNKLENSMQMTWYICCGGDNTRSSLGVILELSPSKYNDQLRSVQPNNLNLKGPTKSICMYDETVLFSARASLLR